MTIASATSIALNLADGKYTEADIATIIRGINAARARSRTLAKMQFRVGEAVEFTNSRNGLTVIGVITKIGPKNIQLRQTNGLGNWRVAPTLLRAVK